MIGEIYQSAFFALQLLSATFVFSMPLEKRGHFALRTVAAALGVAVLTPAFSLLFAMWQGSPS